MSASQIIEGFSLSHAQILTGGQSFLDALASAAAENEDIYGVNDGSLDPDTSDYENEGDDDVLSRWSWLNFADVSVQSGYLSLPLAAELTGQSIVSTDAVSAVNEVQTLTITATGGTFTLTFGGQTTTALAYTASAGTIQTALEVLTNIDTNDIVVAGTGGTRTFTFAQRYAGTNVGMLAVGTGSLTGGTATMAQTTQGAPASAAVDMMDLWHEDSFNQGTKPMVLRMPAKDRDGQPRTLALGLFKVNFKPITFEGPSYKDGLKVNWTGTALKSDKDETGVPFADGKKRLARVLSFV